MAFTTVPEARFLTDIYKTWIKALQSDADFSGVTIRPNYPDKDKPFDLPCVIVSRVGSAEWSLARMSGYHGLSDNPSVDHVGELKGLTYMATYQFDIMTKSILKQQQLLSALNDILKGGDTFTTMGGPKMTKINILDFADTTSAAGTATDLYIEFRFWRDVNGSEISTFDPQLHQYSITVNCWVHYLTEYEVPEIKAIEQTGKVPDPDDSESTIVDEVIGP